ncbi:MAG: hypothetical protein CL460_09340 [Acidimicrobiaceae bacterium]|nr:hypothetical protein [Acidimicrobiaceae bacterium]
MADSDDGDLNPRRPEEVNDDGDVDDGPLLSFDFDEEPMPHWSEPGSGEKPDGGDRPDPPEIDPTSQGGSRLFPQLPDDPHLVDTSDTGLMDAVRSDTIPTVSPGADKELFDTGPLEVEEPENEATGTNATKEASDSDDFSQDQPSTDELFNDTLFDDEEVFDTEIFDDSPIIGRTDEDEAPAFDTGPINEVGIDEREDQGQHVPDEPPDPDDNPALPSTEDEDEQEVKRSEAPGRAVRELPAEDVNNLTALADEPTAELVLDEEASEPVEEEVEARETEGSDEETELAPSGDQRGVDQTPRPAPRVIELFDTPPSQRIMASASSTGADSPRGGPDKQNQEEENGDWSDFGGPAPHWREGRRDYEEPAKVNQDDRVVTHSASRGETQDGSGRPAGRNLPAAIAVGLALAGVFFGLVRVGPWAVLIMVLVALGLAALEFFTSAQNLGYRPATLLGLAAVVGLSLGAYHRGYEAYPVVFALLIVTGLCWFLFDVESQHVTANFAVTLLGFGWVGGLGSFGALILAQPNGDAILIGAVIGTISYDVGGYVIGSTTGQSKVAPRVSPNKTYEGLIGGMMLAIVVTTLVLNRFPGVYPWSESMMDCFWLGLAVALAAPIGDLAQSMIKRDMGVKDMGTVLPGHGGVFDRFDALLFVLPTAYFVAELVFN